MLYRPYQSVGLLCWLGLLWTVLARFGGATEYDLGHSSILRWHASMLAARRQGLLGVVRCKSFFFNFCFFPPCVLGRLILFLWYFKSFYGCLCSLGKTKIKRLVALSGVGQVGFLCIGLASDSIEGVQGVLFYIFNTRLTAAFY